MGASTMSSTSCGRSCTAGTAAPLGSSPGGAQARRRTLDQEPGTRVGRASVDHHEAVLLLQRGALLLGPGGGLFPAREGRGHGGGGGLRRRRRLRLEEHAAVLGQ